ncbi:MAG: PQQ-binding-like beta-propeller repeat protein [Bdellovibrionota bacterium]
MATSSYRDGRYYIGGVNGDILAIQISDGNILWRQNTGASAAGITIGEHMMYIAGSKGKITAIETASGKISWFDELNGVITNKGFYLGKNLYFATGLRNLYGYKVQ